MELGFMDLDNFQQKASRYLYICFDMLVFLDMNGNFDGLDVICSFDGFIDWKHDNWVYLLNEID